MVSSTTVRDYSKTSAPVQPRPDGRFGSGSIRCNSFDEISLTGEHDLVTLALPAAHRLAERERLLSQRDLGLVDRAKEGEKQAFLGLFEAHASRIYSVSLRLVGKVAAAETLTRDIFIEAFSRLDAIRDDATFGRWLYYSAAKTLVARKTSLRPDINS